MFTLSDESEQDLANFCEALTESQGALLRRQVERVCQDPSGKREPRHNYTRPFRASGKLRFLPKGQKAFEFKTNHCRGLFLVDTEVRQLEFLSMGKLGRFFLPGNAPWPH